MMSKMHVVSVTGIVVKDGKYLITKRSLDRKSFPGKWTVPGGNLEISDYKDLPKDTHDHWYGILEKALKREVMEEVNLGVKNLGYVTSLSFIRGDGIPMLVISLYADYAGGEIKLDEESTVDYKWVSLEEAKDYDLIEGIYEELEMLDKLLNGEQIGEWKIKEALSFGEIKTDVKRERLKIGIDIDEVIVEFLDSLLEFYNEKYNKDLRKEDFSDYFINNIIGGTQENLEKELDDFGYPVEKIKLVDGAIDAIKKLSRDHDLFILTARHPRFKHQTETFLNKHFGDIFNEILYTGEVFKEFGITKADLCNEKKIEFMIDDNSIFAREIAEKGVKVFLLDKPWNQNYETHDNIFKVNHWEDVVNKINGVFNNRND